MGELRAGAGWTGPQDAEKRRVTFPLVEDGESSGAPRADTAVVEVTSGSVPKTPLGALFEPRAVAVIGASRRRDTIGGEIFHNLVSRDLPAAVYPVNRNADVVQSVRAYRRLADVPERVDLAVVVVPAAQVPAAVDECIAGGVAAIVVISAGFAEAGAAGARQQRALTEKVRAAGLRMVGPNCLGVINTSPGAELNATFAPTWPPAGNVAFSSQSGALGLAVLDTARAMGIGISQFISVGNRADVSGNDLLEHWEADPRTRVILLYLEGFGNPRRFLEIARRVARQKPIVAVKSGRSAAGARAAGSHTGAIATPDVAVDALLTQAGVIRTDTIEQLFDVAALLANQPSPRGNRLAIATNAGGPGIMAADACAVAGLELPPLAPDTVRQLSEGLPPEASVRNPVDMIASAPAAAYERVVRLLLEDPAVDAVLALYVPLLMTKPVDVAAAIVRATVGAVKPVATCLLGTDGLEEAWTLLRQAHLPTYHFPENAVAALARAARHGRWLARPPGRFPTLVFPSPGPPRAALGDLLKAGPSGGSTKTGEVDQGRWLGPDDVFSLLTAYGIRLPGQQVVRSEEEAATVADRFLGSGSGAVVLKIVSSTLTHKTDVGGVVVDLQSATAVRSAYRAMISSIEVLGRAAEVSGVLVQEMVRDERGLSVDRGVGESTPVGLVECFVGVTADPAFGRLVGFGLGGTRVELDRDVAFRVNPITDTDAEDMLSELRAARLLTGFRGSRGVDRGALVDVLLRVSRMVEDFPEIVELDINPLAALGPGRGAIAVDARVRFQR
jgi:acetyl coenzyme A synthetase (ADP forming)-like protein